MAVDLLVNNTGFGKWGNFLDESRETYAEMVDLNIRAVAELCHVFLPDGGEGRPRYPERRLDRSFAPVPWAAVYGATKAFVLSFSEAFCYEYRDRGVQVTGRAGLRREERLLTFWTCSQPDATRTRKR